MKRLLIILALGLPGAMASGAQTILLDSFNSGAATGSVRSGTSWLGNITQDAGSITVSGTARDDNGWGVTGLSLNAATMTYVSVTGQRNAGNAAPSLVLQFEDINLATHTVSVSTSAFPVGTLTTVLISIGSWPAGFDARNLSGWNLGGGTIGLVNFRLTLDNLAFVAAGAPGAPLISGPTTATGAVGLAFGGYAITATALPTAYGATGLPPGLACDPSTGVIAGTPTVAGVFTATLSATNAAGADTASLTFTIGAGTGIITPSNAVISFSVQ